MSKAMQLKAKIRNMALDNNVPAQAVLQTFMLECVLERISVSKFADNLILKGGMLIASLVGINNRTTMDMDTTIKGYPFTEQVIRKIITEICAIKRRDGVTLAFSHLNTIRADDQYGGYRGTIIAEFESIRTPLKIDITVGDILTPNAVRYSYPAIFKEKNIEIWAYNLETVLAEKVETILRRSVLSTRPRDYYDVYCIMNTRQSKIDRTVFSNALYATAQHRGSFAAIKDKESILNTIQADATMRRRWQRYCEENYFAKGIKFDKVIASILEITDTIS